MGHLKKLSFEEVKMPDKNRIKEYVRVRGENKSRGLKKGEQPGARKVFCGIKTISDPIFDDFYKH